MNSSQLSEIMDEVGDKTLNEFVSYIDMRYTESEQIGPAAHFEEARRFAEVAIAIMKFADWKRYENQRAKT